MQTYANLMSSGGYRPHLDSTDFIKFLRISVIIALILAMAFSIRGNFKGLMQTLERDVVWLGIIALAITVTSSLLSMISVVKVKGLKIVSRVLYSFRIRISFSSVIASEAKQSHNSLNINRLLCRFTPRNDRSNTENLTLNDYNRLCGSRSVLHFDQVDIYRLCIG